ncbi:MAG: sigma-70 family RNA polymerase sigma factor [Opitutaceae bacterium]|nr:sigma-70 family RNA polymerase sigma factor [Opitutaceae bacterium]
MDDPTLLHTYVRERSEPAFAELVARYLPLVHAAALRRLGGDEHRAREVTQMVFTELAQKAAKLAGHPALAAWLHQSTRWHASNLLRGERRRMHHEHAAAEHLATVAVDTPEPAADWNALRPVLDDALDALRESDREAVLQRFMLDRPFAAIGEKLGLSENTARMRVDRALDTLRSALARHGITSTTAALALALTNHAGATTPTGLSSTAIASTACQAAAGAAVAGAAGLVALKIASGIAAVLAVGLATGLWHQNEVNAAYERALAQHDQGHIEIQQPSTAAPVAPPLDPHLLRDLEDEILAAAEFAVPLTSEQQERVRLDTIIRKGQLDFQYAALFRQLHLAPQALDAFKTLLVERNQAIYDAEQLAKEYKLEVATLAEVREITASALTEIDSRIAACIGTDGLTALREYHDLARYRLDTKMLLGDEGFTLPADAAFDAMDAELARKLHRAAPGLADEQFQANGWPVPDPPEFASIIDSTLGPEAAARYRASSEATRLRIHIKELERDAILDGRVPATALSGKGLVEKYEAARRERQTATTP